MTVIRAALVVLVASGAARLYLRLVLWAARRVEESLVGAELAADDAES